jgi:hypothetical protein
MAKKTSTEVNEEVATKFEGYISDALTREYTDEEAKVAIDQFMKDTKLKVSLIGCGNAGGQAVVKAHDEQNFDVFVINSSAKDLSSDVVNDNIRSFIIGNGRGCGKDREISKAFLKDSFEALMNTLDFSNMIEESDVIIIVASTAGGTGSGISPMLGYLLGKKYPGKTFLVFGFLPKKSESPIAQYNAIEFIDELDNMKIPYVLLDSEYLSNEDAAIAHEKICQEFVLKAQVIRGDFFSNSTDDMIDESDELSIITRPGLMNISVTLGVTQEQFGQLSKIMIDNLSKNSLSCPIQKDKRVECMGVVINTPNGTSEEVKAGNYKELTDVIGNAPKVYSHFGIVNEPESQLITILSGLTLPYDRVRVCKDIVEKSKAPENSMDMNLGKEKLSYMKSDEMSRNKILGNLKSDVTNDQLLKDMPDFF